MKTRMYWNYATRSLTRGGQRSLLAIFCIAVGVLAMVALQLVGNMVNAALTDNVRAANGGDLAVFSATSLPSSDLSYFDQLTSQGVLTNSTAVAQIEAETTDRQGGVHTPQLWAVDPAKFPLAGAPTFVSPAAGSLSSLLTGTSVVVTQNVLDDQHLQMGDRVPVHTMGRSFTATIAGVIQNTALFPNETVLIAFNGFAALPSSDPTPLGYGAVYADVPGHTDANAAAAKQKLQALLPLATITTSKDALQQSASSVQAIRYFLQVVGLLALLIGGIGIVNTMQVVLRRRQIEIAMLKTAGYRRHDLALLFGIEASLLGLVGGVVGAVAGVGVSFLVRGLAERAFTLALPATIDPLTVLSGVGIGFCTALIFGLLPIVQASQIRPVAVLRGFGERAKTGIGLALLLGVVLVALFFVLALSIVRNVAVSLGVVGGGGLFLLLLSLGFTLVALIIGRLPVLERFTWWYVLLEVVALALAVLLVIAIPAFGVLFLVVSLMGVVVVLLPGASKSNVKMALRNIGRTKTRTSTTLVALFVGVFAIGLILTLGQNLEATIKGVASTYTGGDNTFIQVSSADKAALDRELAQLSGIDKQTVNAIVSAAPRAINGVPIGGLLQGQSQTQIKMALVALEGISGYDLAQGQVPTQALVKGDQDAQVGRTLTAQDAGMNNVLVPQSLSRAPFNLKLGGQITLAGPDGTTLVTVTVIGFYPLATDLGGALANRILGDVSLTSALTDGHPLYLYSMVVAPSQADAMLRAIQQAVPTARVITLAQELNFYLGLLNNLLIMFTAVASLALLAGLIIIANAVALAMLERRRELGILKAVGYTSRSVLGEVLVENGIVGFVGAVLAMLLATLLAALLANTVFHVDLSINLALVLGVVAGIAVVCMLIAGVVAWGATRVRPLEVLRYE